MSKTQSQAVIVFMMVFIGFMIAKVSDMAYQDEQWTEDLYCEMVSLYKKSKGELGWPDYNRSYDRACKWPEVE